MKFKAVDDLWGRKLSAHFPKIAAKSNFLRKVTQNSEKINFVAIFGDQMLIFKAIG